MIGRIKGLLVEKNPPLVAVDVNGITYELDAPMSTIYELPDVGSEVYLYTHLLVREDAHLLFGFISAREREFFRTLLKVNGVGAKIA
ncbi:MAG: Holliday junction branch migration protein RuvA, partial [Betaproteobacteria bacterium]